MVVETIMIVVGFIPSTFEYAKIKFPGKTDEEIQRGLDPASIESEDMEEQLTLSDMSEEFSPKYPEVKVWMLPHDETRPRRERRSGYSEFMKAELSRLKLEFPTMPHSERFGTASENWRNMASISELESLGKFVIGIEIGKIEIGRHSIKMIDPTAIEKVFRQMNDVLADMQHNGQIKGDVKVSFLNVQNDCSCCS